jgi:hypothetical protein
MGYILRCVGLRFANPTYVLLTIEPILQFVLLHKDRACKQALNRVVDKRNVGLASDDLIEGRQAVQHGVVP